MSGSMNCSRRSRTTERTDQPQAIAGRDRDHGNDPDHCRPRRSVHRDDACVQCAARPVVPLTPPGSACSISIGKGLSKAEPGSTQGLQLCVTDIDTARTELVARGLDITPVRHVENGEWIDGHGGTWNSFMFFSDPDGNGWAIQEKPRSQDQPPKE